MFYICTYVKSDLRHLIHYYFQTFICIIFHFCFRNLSQGSSDTGFFGSMEKDKKQRRQRSVFCEAFSRDFIAKSEQKKIILNFRLDEGKPDAKDVINELIEGVDLKQSVHEEEAERKLLLLFGCLFTFSQLFVYKTKLIFTHPPTPHKILKHF